MRKLILTLATVALVISAADMMAIAGGYDAEFYHRWKEVQAQEKALAAGFAKIEREAARDLSTGMRGVPGQAGGTTATPSTGKRSR